MAAGLFHTRRGEVGQAAAPVPMTRERRPQRAWLLPAVVATICLAPFTPLLLPDDRVITDSIFCDYGSFQLPIREFARQEFLSGRFPLWIPYLGCGTPLHAGQQASLCQPILTPLVLLLGANHGIKVSLFVHLALAFAGTYWLARDLSISRWGGSLAGVVATWGAFPVMHLMEGHVIIVDEYALAPWFLVSLNRLLATPTPRNAAFLALTIGCMAVSGQPQILYYTLLFGFLWAAGSLVFCGQRSSPLVGWDKLAEQAPAHREKGRRQKSSSAFILLPSAFYNGGPALASSLVPPYGSAAAFRMRVIAWGAAALACGCLLGAVQLLPSLELTLDGLSQSERGRSEYASQHALNAIDFARLLVPNAMGNPLCGLKRFDEVDFVHERIGYLGVLPLLLAVYGLTRRSCARWQWGAATLVLFGLTIALGNNTPAFGLMGRSIPGLTLFRCPGRIFSVLTPLIAVLAARGLDVWAERFTNVKLRRTRSRFHTNPKRKRGFAAFSRSSLALRVCVRRLRTGFGEALRPKGGIPAAWRLALAGCAISALIAFGGVAVYQRYEWSGYVDYAQRHVLWELAASAATIVVAAAVLCTLPRRLPPALCCLAALAATMLDLGDQTLGNFSLEPRQAVTAPSVGNGLRAVPGPRVGNGLRAVPGPSNADLADETAWEGHPPIRLVVNDNFQFWPGSLAGTRIVPLVVAARLPSLITNEGGVLPGSLSRLYRAIEKTPGVGLALAGCNYTCNRTGDVWEPLPGALPRIRLVPAADRGLVFTPVEEMTSTQVASLRERRIGSVAVAHEDPQNLALDVSAPDDSLLVVADLDYPGWRCEIDGRPVEIESAHGVFRAVAVEKGAHRATFEYRSRAFRAGGWCSLAGLAIAILLGAMKSKPKT